MQQRIHINSIETRVPQRPMSPMQEEVIDEEGLEVQIVQPNDTGLHQLVSPSSGGPSIVSNLLDGFSADMQHSTTHLSGSSQQMSEASNTNGSTSTSLASFS